jgi:hypothetical protein
MECIFSKDACAELWKFFHPYAQKRLQNEKALRLPKSEKEAIKKMMDDIHSCFNGVPHEVRLVRKRAPKLASPRFTRYGLNDVLQSPNKRSSSC